MAARLGEILTKQFQLDPEKLDRALRYQQESGERLGALLVKLGFIAERDLAAALAVQLELPLAQSSDYGELPLVRDEVTPEFLSYSQVVPLAQNDGELVVAMADPLDSYTINALGLATGLNVVPRVGLWSEIDTAIQKQYGDGASSMDQISDEIRVSSDDQDADDIQQLRDLASEAPVIRLVNLVVTHALERRASDIHIEPFEGKLTVRYRVDGVLREVEAPPTSSTAAVISRIKVLANLNIAERRLPQDGRIKLRIEGREIDMRISTVPTMHGESVVMRILDKDHVPLDFSALGFTRDIRPVLQELLDRPYGIILVTGPTGSGKTTTLYAALETLNTPERKILTVEDPVEYRLHGINQIQVKPQVGLSFANALRSILRQDPDVIMIGEMRDLETAKIAVQSALTGHKVFSTLHTNDSASSVTRLLDMGVEDYLLTSTVTGIIAQRLVRTLCGQCKEAYPAPEALLTQLGLGESGPSDVILYRPTGCAECGGTGYRGRVSILELLVMSDRIREVVLGHADAGAIRDVAITDGMKTMYADGVAKVLAGVTSIEEVARATEEA